MIHAKANFSTPLRKWDGFGINYVETAQTRDYDKWPQDYGSFSILKDKDRQQILDLIFGDDGLQPTVGKMFIDPFQAGREKPGNAPSNPNTMDMSIYDNERTTRWMRYFMREGLKRIKSRGDSFSMIGTLYGPPSWMTKQKIVRGRDLDPAEKYELGKYLVAFAKFMREKENLPLDYLSLYNEGEIECMRRWPEDGGDTPDHAGHDYNMVWPVEQVTDTIRFLRGQLDSNGLARVGIGNGECTQLPRAVKYVEAISSNGTLDKLGLFTSHGFGKKLEHFDPTPLNVLRAKQPEMRGWITSATWGKMDINFPVYIHNHIYRSGANAYIPWAAVQRHSQWVGGDPNPGTAILVDDNAKWSIQRGYYIYKHFCPVGKAGMDVAAVESESYDVQVTAFSSAKTGNPDAAILANKGDTSQTVKLRMTGAKAGEFSCVLTDDDRTYEKQPDRKMEDGAMTVEMPEQGIMTLMAK